MHNISIYLSSRNNYSLLEDFIQRNTKLSDYYFVNIDDFSDPDQIDLGKTICAKYKIPFVCNQARGLQNAAQTMINHLDHTNNKSKFVIWMTHDSNIITSDFFEQLDELVSNDKLNDFGIVGFNILGPQCAVHNEQLITDTQCGMLGRATLTQLPGRGGWYRTPDMILPWNIWGGHRAIAVESPVDMCLAINVNLFKQYINVTDNYHLFCAFDDICMQFLEKGIYNVTLPFLQIWHDQYIKEGKIPVKSASAAQKGDSKHFGDYGPHFIYWENKWGWERDNFRNTFPLSRYENTLFKDFFNHDYTNGPLKTFEL
jgi:hypothetical protein